MRPPFGPILSFEAAAAPEKVGVDMPIARPCRRELEQLAAARADVSRSTW